MSVKINGYQDYFKISFWFYVVRYRYTIATQQSQWSSLYYMIDYKDHIKIPTIK